MAQQNNYSELSSFDKRPIRYTQYITSMLATTSGKTYYDLDLNNNAVQTLNVNIDLVPNGVEETFDPFGFSSMDQAEGISLQKRWRQARSLVADDLGNGVTAGPGANSLSQYVSVPGMEEPAQVNIFPQADASSYKSIFNHITAQMSEIHGDVNDPTSGGPYKMSDFFGFSHVDIGDNGSPYPQWLEYNVDNISDHTGFSRGMHMIQNTNGGHPNDASWFGSSLSAFPTGSGGKKIIYAGGEGTDYDSPLAPWADLGLEGAINGFPHGGFLDALLNPSRVLQLHLGPGRDYFYTYRDLPWEEQIQYLDNINEQQFSDDVLDNDNKLTPSDIRLKENIIFLKKSPSGIPIYKFNYKGKPETYTGTMAQDLLKLGLDKAVIKNSNGYYSVKYNLIDVNMKQI